MAIRTEPGVTECCSLLEAPITEAHATELAAAFAALGDRCAFGCSR